LGGVGGGVWGRQSARWGAICREVYPYGYVNLEESKEEAVKLECQKRSTDGRRYPWVLLGDSGGGGGGGVFLGGGGGGGEWVMGGGRGVVVTRWRGWKEERWWVRGRRGVWVGVHSLFTTQVGRTRIC